MKSRFLVLFFFAANASFVCAQTEPPPPPPPLIFKAPEKSDLRKFISSDFGFEAVFPGDPTTRDLEEQPRKIRAFSVGKNGARTLVQVAIYPNEQNVSNTFDEMRANILRYNKSTIESESDVKLGTLNGKEFAVLTGIVFQRMRVFITGNRIYVVSVSVTNWHILQSMSNGKVTEFHREADRFFDSFKISN